MTQMATDNQLDADILTGDQNDGSCFPGKCIVLKDQEVSVQFLTSLISFRSSVL